MKEKLAWLKRYSETCGVSGFEGRMKDLMLERLEGMAEVSYDKLGRQPVGGGLMQPRAAG